MSTERYVMDTVDPTELAIRDLEGDFVHLFRYVRPGAPEPQGSSVQVLTRTLEVNVHALRALVNQAKPTLHRLDCPIMPVLNEPLQVKFEYPDPKDVEASGMAAEFEYATEKLVWSDQAKRRVMAYGMRMVVVHTNHKWVAAEGHNFELRLLRYISASAENIVGISNWAVVEPHTFIYVVPRLWVDRKETLERSVINMLNDARDFHTKLRTGVATP